MKRESKWQDNSIQFPRLLAEIRAVGLSDIQMEALSVSMGLEQARIEELFERAETEFQKIKGE